MLIVVDHCAKTILPIDLKTSSHKEWDFWQSFLDWNYWIQAKQYANILKANMERHPTFKNYTILPYRFIVVNKETLTPLVWQYNGQFDTEDKMCIYKGMPYIITDFRNIGKELNGYLTNNPKVPNGIGRLNNIEDWIEFNEVAKKD